MVWKKQGKIKVGEKQVEIRSLKLKDEFGKMRRLRVCTVWGDFSKFTKVPAIGCLFKEGELIGILVKGQKNGFIKIGKNFLVCENLKVPFNSISKTNLKKLLKGTNIDIIESDDVVYGREK